MLAILNAAWDQNPLQRPNIIPLCTRLEALASKYIKPGTSFELLPDEPCDLADMNQNQIDSFINDILPKPIEEIMPVEEGVRIFRNEKSESKDKVAAWKCFEVNAELGDVTAMYYKGYCYDIGYVVEKDDAKAAEFYKMAADEGNADAQLKYAFKSQKKLEVFLEYLTKSAQNGNPTALYNLGRIQVRKDADLGIRYLKVAADKGQPDALKDLKKYT